MLFRSLTVPPGAVNKDVVVSMAFDTSVVGLRFSPEGLVFNTPALLDFTSRGLDLRNLLNGTTFDLYWDSEDGVYARQVTTNSLTIPLLGSISCLKGQIPHFSRYAFGR